MINTNDFIPVIGYEREYLVSQNGEVYSIKSNKLLKPYTDKNGYQIVGLFHKGKQKKYKIHRIVAMAYLPNPNNYIQVNHKDENPANNCASNLEWCNCEYNINYGNRNNKVAISLKNNKEKYRRKIACFDKSMSLVKVYPSLRSVEEDGFNHGAVYSMCNGKNRYKSYKGFIWKYADEIEVSM